MLHNLTRANSASLVIPGQVTQNSAGDTAAYLLAAIVEASDDAIISKTLESHVLTWNAAAERIYGYSAAEAIGRSITFLLPPDRLAEEAAIVEKIRRGERVEHFETTRVRKDGRIIDVSVTVSPICDDSGRVIAASQISRDITGQKRAHTAASSLAAIVEASEDAIISKTLESRILTWNAAAERFYGYSEAEAIGQSITFLLPPDRLAEEGLILEKICRGERVEHFETTRVCKDGRIIDVSVTVSPIRDNSGAVIAASQISRDITEQKRAQKQVGQSEAKLRTFLESASQGVVTIDQNGRIDLVNAKMEEIFGYSRDELVGEPLEILLPKRFHEAHVGHRALYFGNPHQRPMGLGLDLAGLRKDGAEFPLEIALSYVPSNEGPLAIAFVNDISERRKIETQLRETQKLESLGVLAGGVAHDFNNLLTGILGNCSLALELMAVTHPASELLRGAIGASERAADLTRQLLAYAGKGRYVIEPVDLSPLIRKIAQLLESSISRTVQLRFELASGLPVVEADVSQMQQIVLNLVLNAAEAIGEGKHGEVFVTTGVREFDRQDLLTSADPGGQVTPGVYVMLDVRDTGCGMDPSILQHIFDPFFSTKFLGRGLGLAAVQGIVRSHKGALRVHSEPGKGSKFQVFLPAMQKQPATVWPSNNGLAGKGTVLVIDDEQIVRQTVKAMLERHGYTVLLAENGKEGIDVFCVAAGRISLVILDMSMPVMAGEETLEHLKLIDEKIPVILSSGFDQVEAVRRFKGRGLAGFIQKPYSAKDIARLVKEILNAAKP